MYVCFGYYSFLLVDFVLPGWIGAAASQLVLIIYAGVRFPRGRVTPFFEPLHAGQLLSICVSFFSSAACMSPCSSRCSGQLFCLCIVCFLLRLACRCSAWLRARRDPPVRKAKKKYAQESKGSLLLSDCFLCVNRYPFCSAGVRGNTREDPEECCWR